MFTLEKTFRFEASHQLMNHDGKCARLHGHSWQGKIIVEGGSLIAEGAKQNMLIDYSDLTEIIKPILESFLDHHHLNETLNTDSPTSEFIARWLFYCISFRNPRLPIIAVEIKETCTSSCKYHPLTEYERERYKLQQFGGD